MPVGDIATWVGVVVAAVLGVVGIFTGVVGQRSAKNANEKAEVANRIAAEALGESRIANKIAEHANNLSDQANVVAERGAAKHEEDWFVDWAIQWDENTAELTLTNTGRDRANQPSVTVAGDEIHDVFDAFERPVLSGERVEIPLPQVVKKRDQHGIDADIAVEGMRRSGIAYVPSGFHTILKVTIRWKTGLGFPQSRELTIEVD